VRSVRIVSATFALLASAITAAAAAPVRFDTDSFPVLQGRSVHIDFNPSKAVPAGQTPTSVAFFLPAHWSFDAHAVRRECTAAQAAAVRCPGAARIGFGHVVAHVSGYLLPGGATDAVAYMTAFLGPPTTRGDLASIVIEVEYLSAKPLIREVNRYLGTKIPVRSSIVGRLFKVRLGGFGMELQFSGFPGGITIPAPLAEFGIKASVTRFKIDIGAVRRVKKPIVHVITVPSASGGTTVKRIRDHVLVGHHLFRRPVACPSASVWPWQIYVGFPSGVQTIGGTIPCYG
jgi:hypothetical protein